MQTANRHTLPTADRIDHTDVCRLNENFGGSERIRQHPEGIDGSVCSMKGKEWDLLALLLDDRNQVSEEQLEAWNKLAPDIRAGEVSDINVAVSLKTKDGRRYLLSYDKDGKLNIALQNDDLWLNSGDYLHTEYMRRQAGRPLPVKMSAKKKRERLKEIIKETLIDIKFSNKSTGTAFLIEAIMIMLKLSRESRKIGVTKEIYPRIARRHGVTAMSVERNIRISIESAWNRMSCDYALEHYPYEYGSSLGRPTNQEFIFAMAGMILRNYPEYLD